jgi:hypothetical protein
MTQAQLLNYVVTMDIDLPQVPFNDKRTLKNNGNIEKVIAENTEQSFMLDKSVLSFSSEVKGQNRKDLLDSMLLAQLAANKATSDKNNVSEWYEKLTEVLSNIGWIVEPFESTFRAKGSGIEMHNAVIDILTAAFGSNYISIIKKTLEAIKNLSESNTIKVFSKNTTSSSKGCFMIGAATETDDIVSLELGAFFVTNVQNDTQILFFKMSNVETTLNYSLCKAEFNEPVYSFIRTKVLQKLGGSADEYIREIEI